MSGIHPTLSTQLFVRSFQVSVPQELKRGLDHNSSITNCKAIASYHPK